MHFIKLARSITIFVFAVFFLRAAAPASAQNDVTRATLPNGLRVVIVPDSLAPVVTTELNYLVGADETPPGFPGMAHAQEHMMFRGSEGLSAAQLADVSAAMGGEQNADTQNTVTQYFYTVPASDLNIVLHIESIRMRGILDADSEWNQERGAIEQEVASDLSNPFYRYYSTALSKIYAGTPYEHDALGTRESFDKTNGAMLKAFYNRWYHPNNAILIIAGDVDPAVALDQVRQMFGNIPRVTLPVRPQVHLRPMHPARVALETDFPVAVSIVTYRMPGFDSADWAAGQVLSDVLASHRGKLYELGVTHQGGALAGGFFPGSVLPKSAAAFAFAAIGQGSASGMVGTVKGIIADYVRNGLPQELIDAAKRKLIASEEFSRNSISGLADDWSETLAVEGRNSPQDDLAALQRVSKADVDRVARRYLNNDTAIVGILTPRPSGKPAAQKGFGGTESFAPKETKAVNLPPWAKDVLANVQVPKPTTNPIEATLPNGLRLIVQPETVSHTVTITGSVKSDAALEEPKGQEGVEQVLGQLFSYGTQTLDRVAFQKALDDIAAQESAGVGFSLSVLTENFDRGVQLLADNELHPALPADAFNIVRIEESQALAGERQSPEYLAQRALTAALYPKDDPEQREATPTSVNALSLDQVKAYYAKVLRPDLTTIVVIGDVTPAAAQASIAKWFGDWKAVGPPPATDLPPAPTNQPASTTVPNAARVQDSVTLAETIGVVRSDPDYYALQVGAHVLGGGFYATRLYHDVRQQQGLAYFIGNDLAVGKTRSSYSISFGSDPQNVSKVVTTVQRDLRAMQTAPVSADELQLAKALLLQEIPLRESSESAIAGGLLGNAESGLPLDEPVLAAQRYSAISAAQVQAAFAKWIRPSGFVEVVQGPAAK